MVPPDHIHPRRGDGRALTTWRQYFSGSAQGVADACVSRWQNPTEKPTEDVRTSDTFWSEVETWASRESGRIVVGPRRSKESTCLVLTRSEVLDVRELVTVAEVTTSVRGLAAEVDIDHVRVGLDRPSSSIAMVFTLSPASLTGPVGRVATTSCASLLAISYALGC